VRKNGLLGNFKAVQQGDVWITEQNMYQQMMNTGDIMRDFHRVFSGEAEGLTYLRKLE
jgi:iron complex transport system substrate-binding protein